MHVRARDEGTGKMGNIIQVHQIGNRLRLRATDGYGAMVFDREGRLAGRRIEFTWFQLNVSPVRLMRS